MSVSGRAVGVMLPRDLPAADFVPFAREAERLGFDELWVVEDCFFRGGIAQAAVALASTSSITVGIGIMPASLRTASLTAMEVGTLAELYPGRLIAGLGHGTPDWMRQLSVWPASPLTMLRENLDLIRSLLAGDRVTASGRYVSANDVVLDNTVLDNTVRVAPPIYAGVRGDRSLEVSGGHADGTILAEPVAPEYLASVLQRLAAGRASDDARGDLGAHRIVAYNLAAVDPDADEARRRVRPGLEWIGEPDWVPHIAPLDFAEEFRRLREQSADRHEFVQNLPDAWVDRLAIVGTPEDARRRIDELHAAGADSVVFIPAGGGALGQLASLATAI